MVKATIDDMEKAETAIFRMHDDKVRKVIFDAQVYASSGAGTYEKAIDMAVKDYASAGLNCVTYKNGRRVNIKDYAEMALKTANKRAYLAGEGEKRKEWGVSTVILKKRGNACPKCLPWVGKILIDDVWSGGTAEEAEEKGYPLMSHAIALGLYHPNCKDVHTTYFEGVSAPPKSTWTRKELDEIKEQYNRQQKEKHAKREEERFERLERCALDKDNKRKYAARREEWKKRQKQREAKKEEKSNAVENAKKIAIRKCGELKNLESQLANIESHEKELTQKVYFDLMGTDEEKEILQNIIVQKKAIREQIKEVKEEMKSNQTIYKEAVESLGRCKKCFLNRW